MRYDKQFNEAPRYSKHSTKRHRKKMVGRFFWIFLGLAAIAFATERIENLEVFVEEQLQRAQDIFENKILEVIYKLKNYFKNGCPEHLVPPSDPYFLQYKDFNFRLKDTELAGYLQHVTFAGFSNIEPDTVELKLLPFNFILILRIDRFQMDGRYKLQGKHFDTPVNAIGQFSSETGNLTLYLRPTLTTWNDSFQIKDLMLAFRAISVKLNYTNEKNSEKFQVLNENLIPFVLEQMQYQYIPPITGIAKILLNRVLLDYRIDTVLRFFIKLLQKV